MDILEPSGYSTQFSRGEYTRAKKEKEEAKSDLEKYTKKLSRQFVSLKETNTYIFKKHTKFETTIH